MKNILAVIPLFLGLSAFAEEPAFSFQKLSEARKTVTLPELTTDEKILIVDQAKLILKDLFVHRDLKLQNYGPSADPLPSLDVIREKAESLSSAAFHSEMYNSFLRLHDFHTTYNLPLPYACYRSLLPVGFKLVKDEFGKELVGVDAIVSKPEVLRLLPGPINASIGDVLIKYNGEDIATVLKRNASVSLGANPAAIKRDSVTALAFTSQKTGFFPDRDEATLTLLDKEGKEKTIVVPWIARGDLECINPPADEGFKGERAENDIQNDYNTVFRKKKKYNLKGPSDLIDSLDPIMRYKTIRNDFGTFGYLRLDSFVPGKLSSEEFVNEVKRILDGPLSVNDGLIIDLRSNGGGYIWIGEAMVQLLNNRNTVPLNFTLKNSQLNRNFWEATGPLSRFNAALKLAESESRAYSNGIPLNLSPGINSLGQSHMKPVALFINASCYSTCDMISADVQDLGAGIIVGEDPNTGAGGANNWNLKTILKSYEEAGKDPFPFKALPHGMNIGFSYRQSIRTGMHAGEVIEDVGVKADMIVEAKVGDLDTSELQLRTITRKLAEESAKFRSWVRVKNHKMDIGLGKRPSVFLKWENTTSIDVKINGIAKGSIDLELSNSEGREIDLSDFMDTSDTVSMLVELLGKEDAARAWKKIINLRTVPATTTLNSPLHLDFSNGITPFVLYNDSSSAKDGWNIKDGQLQVGNGIQYVDNVNSKLSLFTRLEKISVLSFDYEADTEKDFDALRVDVVVDGVKTNLSYISGTVSRTNQQLDLSPYKGKEIELIFMFESDTGVTGKGVIIDNIQLK